jgi:hypothetical protein
VQCDVLASFVLAISCYFATKTTQPLDRTHWGVHTFQEIIGNFMKNSQKLPEEGVDKRGNRQI